MTPKFLMIRETTYPGACKKRSWFDYWLCLLNNFVIDIYDAQISDDPRDNLSWRMTKRSWLYFWLHLAWTGLHELPVCLPCMNYSHTGIYDSKRRCAFGCVLFVWSATIGHTHIHPPSYRLLHFARAQFFFTSLPPGAWEGSVVESIHQLSYLG